MTQICNGIRFKRKLDAFTQLSPFSALKAAPSYPHRTQMKRKCAQITPLSHAIPRANMQRKAYTTNILHTKPQRMMCATQNGSRAANHKTCLFQRINIRFFVCVFIILCTRHSSGLQKFRATLCRNNVFTRWSPAKVRLYRWGLSAVLWQSNPSAMALCYIIYT